MASISEGPLPITGPASVTAAKPRKRRRPRVPVEQRQRATVACSSCRRLKEKCNGNVPCDRCQRYGRQCEYAAPSTRNPNGSDQSDGSSERTRYLETIARHFLGDLPLTDDRLRRIVANLDAEQSTNESHKRTSEESTPALDEDFTVKNVAQNTAHYSGEFSHFNFSQKVKQQVDERLNQVAAPEDNGSKIVDYWRATQLKARDYNMNDILKSLPPRDVSLFLVRMYFYYAQTNTFFVEEAWVMERLNVLYSTNTVLFADDANWLCTTLMVLAVGTQFSHMAEHQTTVHPSMTDSESIDSATDAVGVSFYQLAVELVPNIITVASVDSVQALLLLSHYLLPLDTSGLCYTYLGLALKIATQNGMHRKYGGNDLDARTIDLRNRLWWTTYGLEKRIGILHGRPASISSSDVDADYPSDRPPGFQVEPQSRELENTMTKLTDWLGDIAFVIHMIRRSPVRLRHAYFERLLQVRLQYLEWWQHVNLPAMTATQSRPIVHLHLSHHLNLIYLGRPFIFHKKRSTSRKHDADRQPNLPSRWPDLAKDAVTSAEQIVVVCQALHAGIGLARASYTEFSSCRAAVLVLLAQCLNESSKDSRDSLAEGMKYIKLMSSANISTKSEASIIQSIESAISHLDARNRKSSTVEAGETLSTFKRWASRFQQDPSQPADAQPESSSNSVSAEAWAIPDAFDEFGWSPVDESILDGGSIDFECLGLHHFDEAFSIANGALESMYPGANVV